MSDEPKPKPLRITALAGGIGAAKFLVGLVELIPPESLTVIVNTGDDIELHGLHISPDLDTITYTLAGVINPETGWGLAGDGFNCLEWLSRYGASTWFNLGDRDLATHIFRTAELRAGRSLSEVTDHIRRSLGVATLILPMTDSFAPTIVETDQDEMHLQEYFVLRRCQPKVNRIRYSGIESTVPARGVLEALRDADAVVICPSNPFISVTPILEVPGVRRALEDTRATVAAVTPIVAGKALKGPAAEMLRDLGHQVSAAGVASLYRQFVDLFVLDERDVLLQSRIEELGMKAAVADTLMRTIEDKKRLAGAVLDALRSVRGSEHQRRPS